MTYPLWLIIGPSCWASILGLILIGISLAVHSEYRRLLVTKFKSAFTIDAYVQAVTHSGKRGYAGAVLFGASLLCFAYAIFFLLFRLVSILS
jgi:hypothetical protein